MPRIQEMKKLLDNLHVMQMELHRLLRYPFLPRRGEFRENSAIDAALALQSRLFVGFQNGAVAFQIVPRPPWRRPSADARQVAARLVRVVVRSRSVADLAGEFEAVRRPAARGAARRFCRLESERTRFVVEFSPDQAVDFEDDAGRLIRLRYVPSYRPEHSSGGLAYGLLSPEEERTPDIALEVFPPGDRNSPVPELIVVFDAKYTSMPHYQKLEEVRLKYSKIGVFETGHVLSRQVWALVPLDALSAAASSAPNGQRIAQSTTAASGRNATICLARRSA